MHANLDVADIYGRRFRVDSNEILFEVQKMARSEVFEKIGNGVFGSEIIAKARSVGINDLNGLDDYPSPCELLQVLRAQFQNQVAAPWTPIYRTAVEFLSSGWRDPGVKTEFKRYLDYGFCAPEAINERLAEDHSILPDSVFLKLIWLRFVEFESRVSKFQDLVLAVKRKFINDAEQSWRKNEFPISPDRVTDKLENLEIRPSDPLLLDGLLGRFSPYANSILISPFLDERYFTRVLYHEFLHGLASTQRLESSNACTQEIVQRAMVLAGYPKFEIVRNGVSFVRVGVGGPKKSYDGLNELVTNFLVEVLIDPESWADSLPASVILAFEPEIDHELFLSAYFEESRNSLAPQTKTSRAHFFRELILSTNSTFGEGFLLKFENILCQRGYLDASNLVKKVKAELSIS